MRLEFHGRFYLPVDWVLGVEDERHLPLMKLQVLNVFGGGDCRREQKKNATANVLI